MTSTPWAFNSLLFWDMANVAEGDKMCIRDRGQSARFMDRFRPESELSNLVADILRYSASAYIGRMADVGVTNMRCV